MREALTYARVMMVDRPIDPVLGVTSFVSDWINRHGFYPTFQFNDILGCPGFRLVMNLLKREILLRSLDVPAKASLATLTQRLSGTGVVMRSPSLAVNLRASLDTLPLLHHQPRDKGRYLTSFIGCLESEDGTWNLGFYRAYVAGPRKLVIFMDARTDGHRIVNDGLKRASAVPITLFNGGPLACYLAAAAKLPVDLDSFEAAARLGGHALDLDRTNYPPAPTESEIVIRGVVTSRRETEAPFGEFKGYYCAPTLSPVIEVEQIKVRDEPSCLGLFCGKESGLTLMSLQNEMLLFAHLTSLGFVVDSITYPLTAKGEFLSLIRTPQPSVDLLDAAMAFDQRCKMFVVSEAGENLLGELAIFPLHSRLAPHIRHGRREGERVGIVCDRSVAYDWVEY
ncbi:UbiD family decarboxylase (plasmid) [Bradyrhizobium barranii subsp. apii]|uniref:UbiD family decarboxylase n=1 Tax=Bradyrhizobium barranii subsp. apii TaxID=2819348 RepID=A0A8T5VPL5_9BRAD|nr:UbiD family decarboxylase domain-containing protein [Bradyrhizobium barranii]UPT92169.1 UbiD family decarboxylase [Bradyrhizobium barranii subsp. apii]